MGDVTFKSAMLRGRVSVALLVGSVGVAAAGALLQLKFLIALDRIASGDSAALQDLESLEIWIAMISLGSLCLLVATGISFLMWQYRSVANLPALGIDDCRYTPGWSVGWWFVPVMNLFAPPQIIGDLWRASDSRAQIGTWKSVGFPALVGWWWGFFLLAYLCAFVVHGLNLGELTELSDFQHLSLASMGNQAFVAVSGVLAVLVVRRIYRSQEDRAVALAAPAFGVDRSG